jgi:putative heme-binding domain-containing protein
MRPVIGSEFLWTRHFPEEVQGQFVYACVINMNGIPRWDFQDEKSGFTGKRLPDLLKSTDKNFRPADPKIGPDGALWFGDWHNPLIGHMQYSQRDPNRDKTRGRIYRLTAEGRDLLKPVTQYGKSIPELLDQLKAYERRTRYAARRELWDRPTSDVLAAVDQWVGKLDTSDPEYDRLLTEALWIQQGHRSVSASMLQKVFAARRGEARAAAVRVLADEWQRLPGGIAILKRAVTDEHPRVRLEAVRALSFIETLEAAELAASAAGKPLDYYLEYTLEHTLRALEPQWKEAHSKGEFAASNPQARDFAATVAIGRPELIPAMRSLRALIQDPGMEEQQRKDAMRTVARARGKADAGRDVFARTCVACHKIGDTGLEFGPNLSDVGKRMSREEIAESILYPNLKVDPKYLTVNVTTKDGEELSGVVVSENDKELTLQLGAGVVQAVGVDNIAKRHTTKVSNMPEGLAEALQAEFVDLIEYLAAQK